MSSLNSEILPAPRPNGAAVSYPANRMSDAEYERESAAITAAYGGKPKDAKAKAEQAWAILYYRAFSSGWTQEELSKREGVSQQRVSQKLKFGEFLHFTSKTSKAENQDVSKLTEAKFNGKHGFWYRTDKNDEDSDRFKQVLALVEQSEPHAPRRKNITKDLREKFCDGKWHRIDAIAKHFGTDEAHVFEVIRGQRDRDKISLDKKRVGKDGAGNGPTDAYRMFRADQADRTVSFEELTTKLAPILEGLQAEGKKNMATMSPATVAVLANRLKQLIEEWEK